MIAGHGRLAAAHLLGLPLVPVIPLPGLSEVQKRQFMLADSSLRKLANLERAALAMYC